MPITPFLKDSNFTPDLTRVVKVAFEMTCTALKFPRNDNPSSPGPPSASSSLQKAASIIPMPFASRF